MRWLVAIGLAATCGCNSIRTTAVDRCEHDTLVVNPDRPMKGIPVSLRVPTHLELKVIETTYWEKRENPGEKSTLIPLSTCRATRSVKHDLCYTEKIFLVDPVKPTAGTQKYGFAFWSNDNPNQDEHNGKGYLRNLTYSIDDKTIQESAKLASNVLGLINAFQISANEATPNEGTILSTERAVAYARFDINSCTFEDDVAAFLDCNVNQVCHTCPVCPKVCQPTICN